MITTVPTVASERSASESRPSPALVTLVVALAALMLVPIGYVVAAGASVGPSTLISLIMRPRVGELLANTVLLVVVGVPATMVLGVGGAWIVERTAIPARRFFTVLLVAPLAIPAFVSSYGWASAVPSLQGLSGGLLIAVLAYFPLVYLPAIAAIRGLDPTLEESARSLGLGSAAVFFRVVLPQLRLAVLGGGLIVGLHLLAEYGAFAFIRFDTFTTAIVTAYQSTFAGPSAASLGIVLTVLCLLLLVTESAARGRSRYARVGPGAPRLAQRTPLGRLTPVVVSGLALVGVASVGVPIASVLRWLSAADLSAWDGLPAALAQTLALSLGGAAVALLIAAPVAWLSGRYPGRWARALEGPFYLASSLPAIIIALALVTVTIRIAPALYQTAFTVILAYAFVFLPRILVPLRAGIAQVPESLEEAARSLGLSPVRARLRVTVPLLVPSIAAGVALVTLGSANELTATLLLAPTGTRTLATEFWTATSALEFVAAAPYAATLILLSIPAVAVMLTQARGRLVR